MAQLYPVNFITTDTGLETKYLCYLIDPTDSNITVTLPDLTNDGLTFVLKNVATNTNTVTVTTLDGKLIDGNAILTIFNGSGVTLTSKRDNWYSIGSIQSYSAFEGFSAFNYSPSGVKISDGTVADNIITKWTSVPTPPYAGSSSFDNDSGVYKVPATGFYDLKAIVPIQWSFPATAITSKENTLSANCNPYVHIYSSNTKSSLCMANLAIISINPGAGSVRYPVHRQTVTLSDTCYLQAGDTITLRLLINASTLPMLFSTFYIAGGGSIGGNYDPSNEPRETVAPGATFSIRRAF